MSLAGFGVDRMSGVVGIPVTSLAIVQSRLAFYLSFHNEQSAGYAASAYGYLARQPGILLNVSGPGSVHGLAGMSNAMANALPMVTISGSCDQSDFGRGDFQELDQIEAVKPFSKFSVKAKDIKEISHCVARVLTQAVLCRPGGCYFDLPSNLLHQCVSESQAEKLLSTGADNSGKQKEVRHIPNSEIERTVSLLRRAERPLIIFGKGAAFARAEGALKKLVGSTGVPFFPTPMGKACCLILMSLQLLR